MTPITDPTALADQYGAVLAEIRTMLRHAEHTGAGTVRHTPATPWLASRIHQLTASLRDRTTRTCPHLAHGPRITFAAVWHPGLLVCADCYPALLPDPAEDTTCDRCRHTTAALEPHAAALGPVLLVYGLCHRCTRNETPAPLWPPTSTRPTRTRRRPPQRRR